MILALHLVAAGAYLAGWAIELRAFRSGDPAPRGRVLAAIGVAVAAHLSGLVGFVAAHSTLPLVGLGPASSTLALLIGLVALVVSFRAESRPATLLLLPPLVFFLGEAIAVGLEPAAPQTAFRGPWFVFHVGSVFAGYAALLLGSAAATMYLLQFRSLKRKRFGSVFRFFPSLDALDRLNRAGLYVGFPALTLGLVAGWSWTLTYGGGGLALGDPEVVLGIITWVAYLAAIITRLLPGSRNGRAAAVSAVAFVVTAAAFLSLRVAVGSAGFFL